jgi:diguanylate cyclase (GGDEF)-like protein/PAS domain S-box-containing protein
MFGANSSLAPLDGESGLAARQDLARQLAVLLNTTPNIIFFKDGAGRWLHANKPATALFQFADIAWRGKTTEELTGLSSPLSELLEKRPRDDAATWRTGAPQVFEGRLTDLAGNLLEFELQKIRFFKASGEREGMICIGRDLTETRQLERSEHALRVANAAIELQQGGVMITNERNIIESVNSAFTRLTGYSADDVIGKTPAILKSGQHDAEFYRGMWATLKHDQCWEGLVFDRRKNGEIYPKWLSITAVAGAHGMVTNYVGTFTDQSGPTQAKESIYRLAFHDPLTNLPNRRLMGDRLAQALACSARSGHYGAVLLVDLDHFKIINNMLGHKVGDQLLVKVGQRLSRCIRQGDTLGRIGGDEFALILENLSTEEADATEKVRDVAEKIQAVINQPYLLKGQGQEHFTSPSIGVSLFWQTDETPGEIFIRVDAAMYQAKNAGRNTVHFFDPEMQAQLKTRTALKSELRHALRDQQFHLHFQAEVDHAGHVLGAEVLLRWAHPQRGSVPPALFIPIAEECGLIVPIGEWVLHSACAQLKAWEKNPNTRHLQLAVNVSARQFYHPAFVEQVLTVISQTGVNASRLKLELTESLVLDNIADTIEKMNALNLRGIRFSLDDFGTGYSSLAHLTKLPLSQLKIDQSFVQNIVSDPHGAAIVQTIIGMASNLGLSVIAEGVETEEQRACLERFGCPTYQGYLFAKPMPMPAFEELAIRAIPA